MKHREHPQRRRRPADLATFLHCHHRLPRLGDAWAPWTYRGWLLPYVIQLHALIPAVADRWGYHLRTLEAGRLLDELIPQVGFGPADARALGRLYDWSRLIGRDCGGWSDFRTLLDWLAWGLALSWETPALSDAVNEKLYRAVDVGPLLQTPSDYLGEHVAVTRGRGWNPTGFYPTPHSVVELMVRMLLPDAGAKGRDPRLRTVCDPTVGSGRMLLHASNVSLCLYGQDIDPLAVTMCKINGALYAPWLSFPLPASILGTAVPAPPTPLPLVGPPPADVPVFRTDDRQQGLLFPVKQGTRHPWRRRKLSLAACFPALTPSMVRQPRTGLQRRMYPVTVTIEKDELVIRLPLNKPPIPSATGKSLVVASTRGNQVSQATVQGQPVIVGVNAYILRPAR
jgi:hypothetical protein